MGGAVSRPTCETCPYWAPYTTSRRGGCRRNAPNATNTEGWCWAPTDRDHWCGEHPDFQKLLQQRMEQSDPEKPA